MAAILVDYLQTVGQLARRCINLLEASPLEHHGAITAQRFMYTEQHDYSVTAYRYNTMYVEQH